MSDTENEMAVTPERRSWRLMRIQEKKEEEEKNEEKERSQSFGSESDVRSLEDVDLDDMYARVNQVYYQEKDEENVREKFVTDQEIRSPFFLCGYQVNRILKGTDVEPLGWGELYAPDELMESDDSDVLIEEADEIDDQVVEMEEKQARFKIVAARNERISAAAAMDAEAETESYNCNLGGGDDTDLPVDLQDGDDNVEEEIDLLVDLQDQDNIEEEFGVLAEEHGDVDYLNDDHEVHSHATEAEEFPTSDDCMDNFSDLHVELLLKIFLYSEADEVYNIERVCKHFRSATMSEEFWAEHPIFNRRGASTQLAFKVEGLRQIKMYQNMVSNDIMDVLREENDCVAEAFRDISKDLVSKMICFGSAVRFNLRGDTIGYLCELMQGYMIKKLALATSLNDRLLEVNAEDISMAFFGHSGFTFFSDKKQIPCNVGMQEHGKNPSVFGCSCSLSSFSDTIWRWPDDNCHDVLPDDVGRKIIRRLAYRAGIREMSDEAYILAEAEFLHALGGLLVDAYEFCVEMDLSKKLVLIDSGEDVSFSYNEPCSVDMFVTPPPPFWKDGRSSIYTIVPGQIKAVAEKRGVGPSIVYGDVWVPTAGFTTEQEYKIEKSYYYNDCNSNDESDESWSDEDEIMPSGEDEDLDSLFIEYYDTDDEEEDDRICWSDVLSLSSEDDLFSRSHD